MKVSLHLLGVALLLITACGAQQDDAPKLTTPETEEEKQLYAIGLSVAGNTLGSFKGEFSDDEIDLIATGFAAALREAEPAISLEEYAAKLNDYMQKRFANVQARMQEQAGVEKEKGTAFLEKAASETGAIKTESGIVYLELLAGSGAQPKSTDKVKVHYTGKLIDGTVFDSSVERGEPIEHPLSGFVPGWSEGVGMMKVGGKAKLVIPPELAYGDQSPPGSAIPPGSTLVFEVELIDIVE
jgi:FKBP-type peptidyl-prolyl cis-trans isomerase FkpA